MKEKHYYLISYDTNTHRLDDIYSSHEIYSIYAIYRMNVTYRIGTLYW